MSIAVGASSGSSSRDANSVSTTTFTLISPIVRVTGSISASTRRTAGSRQSSTIVSRPSRRRSHGIGMQEIDERPQDDDGRVQVELGVLALDPWHSEDEAENDHQVPRNRCERRHRELVVRVENPDDDPGEPHQDDDREQDPGETDGEVEVAAGIAERPHQERRQQDEERR